MDYKKLNMKELREEFKKRRFSRGIPDTRGEIETILVDHDQKMNEQEETWRELVHGIKEPRQGYRVVMEDGSIIPIIVEVILDHTFKRVTYQAKYTTQPGVEDFSSATSEQRAIYNAWSNIMTSSRGETRPVEFLYPGQASKAEVIKELHDAQQALRDIVKMCVSDGDTYYHRTLGAESIARKTLGPALGIIEFPSTEPSLGG